MEGKNHHMRGYTGAETITIDGYWKDGEGIVLAVHHAAGLTLRLRQLLFAWHKASWYGSEVEDRIDERQKLYRDDYFTASSDGLFGFTGACSITPDRVDRSCHHAARLG